MSEKEDIRFDEVLDVIGGFKIYQKWIFLLACIPNLIAGLFALNPVFLLGTPDHRCKVPGFDNDTFHVQDGYHACLINASIPITDDGTYDSCNVYVGSSPGYICRNKENKTETPVVKKTKCSEWVYDKTVQERTFVSQNNLVCDKTVMVANAQMIFYGGMLLGSILSGIFSDIYGRKPVMYTSFWILTISSTSLAFCEMYWQFVLANFIQGASIIGAYMPAFIITMEITSVDKRLWPGVASNIPYLLGLFILSTVAYFERRWNKLALYTALPCLIMLPLWWLIPESPRWLVSKQRKQEAEVVMARAARWNGTSLPANIIDKVRLEEEPSWTHFFRVFTSLRMFVITMVTCFNWMVVSISYYGLSLNMSSITGDYYLNFALSGLVEAPGYVLTMLLVDRMGRRKLYCTVMLVGGLYNTTISSLRCTTGTKVVIMYHKDLFFTLHYGHEGKVTDGIILTLALIGKCCATAGFSIQYLYTAELFPTIIRNAGIGVSSMSANVGTMTCPYILILGKQMGGALGQTFPLVIIGGLSLTATFLTLLLPETVNQPMPETIEDAVNNGRKRKTYQALKLKSGRSSY